MKVTPLSITDVILFELKVIDDEQEVFFESFNQKVFRNGKQYFTKIYTR